MLYPHGERSALYSSRPEIRRQAIPFGAQQLEPILLPQLLTVRPVAPERPGRRLRLFHHGKYRFDPNPHPHSLTNSNAHANSHSDPDSSPLPPVVRDDRCYCV